MSIRHTTTCRIQAHANEDCTLAPIGRSMLDPRPVFTATPTPRRPRLSAEHHTGGGGRRRSGRPSTSYQVLYVSRGHLSGAGRRRRGDAQPRGQSVHLLLPPTHPPRITSVRYQRLRASACSRPLAVAAATAVSVKTVTSVTDG